MEYDYYEFDEDEYTESSNAVDNTNEETFSEIQDEFETSENISGAYAANVPQYDTAEVSEFENIETVEDYDEKEEAEEVINNFTLNNMVYNTLKKVLLLITLISEWLKNREFQSFFSVNDL